MLREVSDEPPELRGYCGADSRRRWIVAWGNISGSGRERDRASCRGAGVRRGIAARSGVVGVRYVVLVGALLLAAPAIAATWNEIDGTADADHIRGSAAPDRIRGLEGNDVLRGRAGDDRLVGGPGDDVLNGGPGQDT